jgi:hypothetical protein
VNYEYKMVAVKATGPGILTRTPTEGNVERELRQHAAAGWRLVQVLTLGLLFRKTWLVLERPAGGAAG